MGENDSLIIITHLVKPWSGFSSLSKIRGMGFAISIPVFLYQPL